VSYRIIINSTGRAATLADKTLPMLAAGGIERDGVEVWVANTAEATTYDAIVGGPVFVAPHDPTDKRLEVVGVNPVGLGKARNHVISHAKPGERLVFIDDDIYMLVRAMGPKDSVRVDDLDDFFTAMFRDLDNASATLWGVYPVANPYFMRPRTRYDLCYIIGALFGIIVTGQPHELVTLDDKEDYERSIRHYLADGHIVRNDRVAPVTTYYKGEGGLQLSRTPERVRLAAEWLTLRYPGLCSLNLTKRSGWAEVRLRDSRHDAPQTPRPRPPR
jgi:hypothetical protein